VAKFFFVIHFDKLSAKTGISEFLRKGNAKYTPSRLVGLIAYWIALLAVFLSVAKILDLDIYLAISDKLVQALPNLIAGILVGVVGSLIVAFLANVVETIALNASFSHARLRSRGIVSLPALLARGGCNSILRMELRHLRYFVAVGRCLNFSRAAEMLHLSQPPLSRQIQEFEEEVGAALFDRTGKKTALTEAGEYLLVESEKLLEGLEAACRTAKSIAQKSRALKVGCVSFFQNARLAPFLEEVKSYKPDLKIEILIMPTEAQERALFSGSIEVGFARSWLREESLTFEPVAEESYVLVYPETALLEGDAEACFAALASRPFIAIARSVAPGLADTIAIVCADYGPIPLPAYECNDAFSLIGLVASGLGWSIIPEFELDESHVPGMKSLRLQQKGKLGICYRKTGMSEQVGEFVAIAKEYFSRLS
jgi:DNA-binding transcriptional LysR family regulator